MIFEKICVGELAVNCYILAKGQNSSAIIIDPGEDEKKIRRILDKFGLKPGIIINTHGHIDHIGCDDKFAAPIYVHELDAPLLRNAELNLSNFLGGGFSVTSAEVRVLRDKDIIEFEGISLEVIHTPGHTPGGICLLMKKPQDKILFTGDSLFYRSIGRTDFPGADERKLIGAIKEKIFTLADDTEIFPGHGPSSTIGKEKQENPFLS